MRLRRFSSWAAALAAATVSLATSGPSPAAVRELRPKLPDLTGVVTNPDRAIALGKALFWDTGVGSDGMACAGCHFHAGADARTTNALSPGLLALPEDDPTFGAECPQLRDGEPKRSGRHCPLDNRRDDDA